MKSHTLLKCELHAGEVKIRVRRLRIASAIPHINPLVGVHDKEINRIIPIALKQRDISVVHPSDAKAHVLSQLLAQC